MDEMFAFKTMPELDSMQYLAKRQIGSGVFVSKKAVVDNKAINYMLGVNIPRVIEDSRSGEIRLKFIKFDNVSTIEFLKKDDVFTTKINRDKIADSVNNRLLSLVFETENVLLSKIYDKLAKIPSVQNSLNPVKEILNGIHEKGGLTFLELKAGRNEKKVLSYLRLLEDLELIKKCGDRYVSGNKMIHIEKELGKDTEKIYTRFLSVVIESGYGYIRNYLKLASITPYLRWSTAYYMTSIQFQKPLYLTEEKINKYYYNIYGVRKPLLKSSGQINQLVSVGILRRENNYLCADKETYDRLLEIVS